MDATSRTLIKTWKGRISHADPHDLPPGGMQEQDNLQCTTPGALVCRKGLQPQTTRGSVDGIELYYFERPEQNRVVMETSDGAIKTARAPSFGTLTTIKSSLNTFQPACFGRDRFGNLYFVNGLNEPQRWDGLTAATEHAGIDAPTAAPTVGTSGGGAATAGSYVCAYRYIDDTLPNPAPSSLSALTTATATANQQFDWSAILQSASTATRPVQIQLWRSLANAPGTLYLVTTLTNTPGGAAATYTDQLSDATLEGNTALPVTNTDGSLNAYRFTPPPSDKAVVVFFGDRAWYMAGVDYTVGTVATTSASATLTGSGTAWTSEMVGRFVYIQGETSPFTVSGYTSATSLTLSANASATASGLFYSISPSPLSQNQILFSEQDEAESVPATNEIILQNNTGDEDHIVGGMAIGATLYAIQERHLYAINYVQDPADAVPAVFAHRGAFNNRCHDSIEGVEYLMDQFGAYRTDGNSIQPISGPIQDLWANGTLDFANSKWFFVQSDPTQEVVRFHVGYAADGSTRPKHWLEFDVRGETWTTGSNVDELGGGCIAPLNGRARVLLAGEDDIVFLSGEETTDVVSAAISGTVTAATSNTLTDGSATFTDAVIGAPVYITSGPGKGEWHKVTARTTTRLTIADTWTETPTSISTYLVGGIAWSFKTGLFAFPSHGPRGEEYHKRAVRVTFQPTTGDASFDIRRYRNHESSPVTATQRQDVGVGVTFSAGSADAVIDMQVSKSAHASQRGMAEFKFGGVTPDRSQAEAFAAFQLRGCSTDEAIKLFDLHAFSMEE